MVALVDIRGSGPSSTLPTLAAEWRYDPYGNVVWGRVHTPHPALSCGHRGVFFDRLDEPIIRFAADVAQGDVEPVVPALGQTWDTRVLVPPQAWGNGYDLPSGKAKLIGHMRNRVYLPRLMRFAQRDPNATGQLVMAGVMHSGQSMSAHPGGMQLESLFGDGPNLHGYLAGRPRGNSDPTGLFLPSPADLVASAVMVGVRGLRGGLEGMTEQYAANLEDDLDWAMDWSRPDNDYSRLSSTWVGQSFMDGMYGGLEDGLGDALSDFSFGLWPVTHEKHGPAMAGLFAPSKVGGVTGKMTSRGLRVLGKTLRTFRTKVFNIGSTKFILDKAGLSHILKRHHRDVWDKTVGQKAQTFFSDGMSINSVVKAIEAVVIQNRSNLARMPNGRGQVEGIFQGKRYILGVTDGRIGQFYPLPD